MTAMLACDGCGQIVQERADDADPTARWWVLSPGPTIGGAALGLLALSLDGLDGDPEPEPEELPPLDPPRHFCSDDCLLSWAAARTAAPTGPKP